MRNQSNTSVRRASGFAGAAVAVALLAAACSSSSGNSGGGSSGGAQAGGGVEIETHSGPMGTYLTDGSGKSLYLFASDTATKSTCNGACVAYWPPLTGTAHAMGGASASKLSTITRSDGSKQIVYAGHPLYYFKDDSAAGDTKGQGSNNFGAKWWLVAPSGDAITSSASSGSGSSSGTY